MTDQTTDEFNPVPKVDSPGERPQPTGNAPSADLMRHQLDNTYSMDPSRPQSPVAQPPSLASVAQTPIHGQVDTSQDAASTAEIKQRLLSQVRGHTQPIKHRWKPFLIAFGSGLLYLAISYNEIAIAQVKQYLSPGSGLTTPVIVDPTVDIKVGREPRIIIPKINVDVPVVYDVKTYEETAIQAALERGVVHYGNTAVPGQSGNNVIVGHSSNNFFNSGKYKFAFVLLGKLEVGDTFILHYGGERYIYKVALKRIIEPNDFSLIQPTQTPTATLITCTPPGTSWQRLVIQGEQISPDPAGAEQGSTEVVDDLESVDTVVPGNAPSFWSNIFDIFN